MDVVVAGTGKPIEFIPSLRRGPTSAFWWANRGGRLMPDRGRVPASSSQFPMSDDSTEKGRATSFILWNDSTLTNRLVRRDCGFIKADPVGAEPRMPAVSTNTGEPAAAEHVARAGPLDIAFVVNDFPALSETFVVDEVLAAVERGHRVHVYAFGRCPHGQEQHPCLKMQGLTIRYLHAPTGATARVARAVATLLAFGWRHPAIVFRTLNVFRYGREAAFLRVLHSVLPFLQDAPRRHDVIHCQFGPLGRRAVRLRQIGVWDGAAVTTFRGYDATQYLRNRPNAYVDLFREGELFLAVSRSIERHLINRLCPPDRLVVQRSGVRCQAIAYRERRLGPGEPVRILSVARLVEKKGIEYGIHAIGRLVAAGKAVRYEIAGEGALRAELERLVEELRLQSVVFLLGGRSHHEVLERMQKAHILLVPSVRAAKGDEEGIPIVVNEAMASGLPVVATAHAGVPEIIEHGVSGFLVEERNDAALADQLARLIDESDAWQRVAHAARRKIEQEYDSERLGTELDRLYWRAIEERQRALTTVSQPRAAISGVGNAGQVRPDSEKRKSAKLARFI